MDRTRDSFLMYGSWWDNIKEMYGSDEETCKSILYSIAKYGFTGEKTFPCEKMFLMQAFSQIDSAVKKHDAAVSSGRTGGKSGTGESKKRYGNKNASKTQANASTLAKNASKTQPSVSVSDSDSVSDSNSDSKPNGNDSFACAPNGGAISESEKPKRIPTRTELYGTTDFEEMRRMFSDLL